MASKTSSKSGSLKDLKVEEGADPLLELWAQGREAARDAEVEEWRAQTIAHYGKSVSDVAARIRDRIDALGETGARFLKLMDRSQLGDHPDVFRVLDALVHDRRR